VEQQVSLSFVNQRPKQPNKRLHVAPRRLAAGTRPLWLLFVTRQPPTAETRSVQAPTPRQAEAIYDERFNVEHALRFGKQKLGLVKGQFNGLAAEGGEQTWVELVATVYWLLWALRAVVNEQ
jgi:hypothetical protein